MLQQHLRRALERGRTGAAQLLGALRYRSGGAEAAGGGGGGGGGGLWGAYNRALEQKPLLTKSITCGVLSFAADVVCQKVFPAAAPHQQKQTGEAGAGDAAAAAEGAALDWFRLTKFTVLGVLYVSPSLHVWYGFLARMFPGAGLTGTMQRLACDQLLFAPAFIAGFLSLALVFEGRPESVPDKLQSDWLPTMRANLSLWVPSMFINFRFVPAQYQVLFSNCVGFFWNIYLSWVVAQDKSLPLRIADGGSADAKPEGRGSI